MIAGGATRVLHDRAYQFEDQQQWPLESLTLESGDVVQTECTYQNDSSNTVTPGESCKSEMCFSVLYRYPAGSSQFCEDGPFKPCAAEGAQGNSVGVGRYCTAGGKQCSGTASLCLADVAQIPFANFCTLQCQGDSDCGEGGACVSMGDQRSCIPTACLGGSS